MAIHVVPKHEASTELTALGQSLPGLEIGLGPLPVTGKTASGEEDNEN